jgi:hypothetical protein
MIAAGKFVAAITLRRDIAISGHPAGTSLRAPAFSWVGAIAFADAANGDYRLVRALPETLLATR